MIPSLKQLACGCVAALSFAGSAQAAPIVNEWYVNPIGEGRESAQIVHEYLDVNGTTFMQLEGADGRVSGFRHHAVYTIVQADSNGMLFPIIFAGGNITATFEGAGAVLENGKLRYDGGTLRMYQNPVNGQYGTPDGVYGANLGRQIARFDLINGTAGYLDAQGRPLDLPIRLRLNTATVEEGYFFDEKGQDLAHGASRRFDLNFTSALGVPYEPLVSELACQFAGFTGPGCDGSPYDPRAADRFLLWNNGQVIMVAVPEPGSLALFGIALLGAGMVGRRRAAAA